VIPLEGTPVTINSYRKDRDRFNRQSGTVIHVEYRMIPWLTPYIHVSLDRGGRPRVFYPNELEVMEWAS
jgi:hypothetical protein